MKGAAAANQGLIVRVGEGRGAATLCALANDAIAAHLPARHLRIRPTATLVIGLAGEEGSTAAHVAWRGGRAVRRAAAPLACVVGVQHAIAAHLKSARDTVGQVSGKSFWRVT